VHNGLVMISAWHSPTCHDL